MGVRDIDDHLDVPHRVVETLAGHRVDATRPGDHEDRVPGALGRVGDTASDHAGGGARDV
jgi:hypothetical protein